MSYTCDVNAHGGDAVLLITDLRDGNTAALCLDHVAPGCLATMETFGVTPFPFLSDEGGDDDEDRDDREGAAPPPRARGRRRVAVDGASRPPQAVAEGEAEELAR